MTNRLPRVVLIVAAAFAVLIASALGISAMNDDGPPAPHRAATAAEADDALAALVAIGTGADPNDVCQAMAASPATCRALLGAGLAPPDGPPVVVEQREVPSREVDGGLLQGGRLLTVCGARTDGSAYRTDVLFWVEDDEIVALHPVWWSGARVITDGVEALGDGRIGAVATSIDEAEPPAACE
jgi:hypothetical protein